MLKKLFLHNKFAGAPINTVEFFDIFWLCWKAVGVRFGAKKWYITLQDIMVNIFVTIFLPLHLTMGLFLVPKLADAFKNLAATITSVACSIKHYFFRYKLPKIRELQLLLKQLDERIVAQDERDYYNGTLRTNMRNIMIAFCCTYAGDAIVAAIDVLYKNERELMYPAWFPFDWSANIFTYYVAVSYQIISATIQIMQNLPNDTFAPIALCAISGHAHLLAMRVAKVGYDESKTLVENERELNECIEDHKKLLRIFDLLQDIFWYTQLVQFSTVALSICLTVVCLLYFVENFLGYIYYMVYLTAIMMELFPACYFGSQMSEELEALPYAIFKCNWVSQRKSFKQNLRVFTELALKPLTLTAGGIIDIHLTSFVATCKMAYSIYTVLLNMK
ncbi:odorant receptor 33a-like [Eurosta solidaginis]|uniref:odorant receptor 33a-like n=1 Tax=Eurosta solidaginis TaxID=178769 RepID=UPI0035311790